MDQIRLGYACQNLSLKEQGRTNRVCRLANANPTRLEGLARENLAALAQVLAWNVAHGISVFRISSQVIPLASHPDCQWPWQAVLSDELDQLAQYVKTHALRLSMHPGQFTVLNSPKPEVVAASIKELIYHAEFLDALGMGAGGKIVIHVGGVYGDKQGALRRFSENYMALPANVRKRLVVENDERNYGAGEVLALCQALRAPMVFDELHHQCLEKAPSSRDLLSAVCETWAVEDGPPKFHLSSQKEGARVGTHADYVDADDFSGLLERLPQQPIDIMFEAKQKEQALLQFQQIVAP